MHVRPAGLWPWHLVPEGSQHCLLAFPCSDGQTGANFTGRVWRPRAGVAGFWFQDQVVAVLGLATSRSCRRTTNTAVRQLLVRGVPSPEPVCGPGFVPRPSPCLPSEGTVVFLYPMQNKRQAAWYEAQAHLCAGCLPAVPGLWRQLGLASFTVHLLEFLLCERHV